MEADASRDTPDLSAERARRDFALLMPGAVASVLAFVTFGTTQQFRQTMYRTFVPRRWRWRREEEEGGRSAQPRRGPADPVAVTSAEHSEHSEREHG